MVVDRVRLRFAEAPSAYVRELTGRDEQEAGGLGTLHAIALIDRTCVAAAEDALRPGAAIELAAHDRDRILAAMYRRAYGSKIAGLATCRACGAPFDFELLLDDLQALLETPPTAHEAALLPPPTGRDELAVADLPPEDAVEELLRRCLRDTGDALDVAAAEAILDANAPLLDLELTASCPQCGAAHELPFDIQALLLGELARDARQLWPDVHALASTYRWSFDEIVELPRNRRRALADLIAGERGRSR